MYHITIKDKIEEIVIENSELTKKLAELRKVLPPYEWMIKVAERYGFDTDFINKGIERDAELLQQEVELENDIKINKVEIRLLWKQLKSISNQK